MSADLELDNFGHRNLGNIEKFGHIGKFAHIRILAHYSQRKSWTIGHMDMYTLIPNIRMCPRAWSEDGVGTGFGELRDN